jgi:hypothetical protein
MQWPPGLRASRAAGAGAECAKSARPHRRRQVHRPRLTVPHLVAKAEALPRMRSCGSRFELRRAGSLCDRNVTSAPNAGLRGLMASSTVCQSIRILPSAPFGRSYRTVTWLGCALGYRHGAKAALGLYAFVTTPSACIMTRKRSARPTMPATQDQRCTRRADGAAAHSSWIRIGIAPRFPRQGLQLSCR